MVLASACVILLVLWVLLAYVAIPLPFEDPFFAWLRRQWLMEGIAGLTFLGVIGVVCSQWRRRTPPSKIPWWNVWWVWMGWVAVSCVYSIDRGASLRSGLAMLSYGLLAYVVGSLIRSPGDLVIWARFIAGVAVIAGLEGLFQYSGTFEATLPVLEHLQGSGQLDLQGWGGEIIKDFLVRKRITSFFGWPNLFAGFLLLTIPVAGALAFDARTRRNRVGWGLGSILLGGCLVLTLSMGGWIAAILTASVAWWWLVRTRRSPAAGSGKGRSAVVRAVCVGLILCAVVSVTSYMVAKRARPLILASVSSRTVYAQGARRLLAQAPFAGTGLGTFGVAYHAVKPLEEIEGQHTAQHAHNTLLEVGAELGVIGLVCFVMFLWQVGRLLAVATRGPSHARLLVLRRGLVVGLMGFFIHSLLEQTFVESVTAPFWWIALGLVTGASSLDRLGHIPDGTKGPSRHTVRFALLLLLCCLGCVSVVRYAAADLAAAHGAWLDLSGHPDRAMTAFERAQRYDPFTSRYPLEQGERYLKDLEGRPPDQARPLLEQAQRQFERTVQLSPWLGYAWLRLGVVSWQLGHVDKAMAAIREAVHQDPNSRAALAQLVQMLSATGLFDEAQQAARQFQRLEPLSPDGYAWEALAWQGGGETPQALTVYRQVVERFPDHFPSLFNLAELLRAHGALNDAARMYEAFLRAAPSSEVAQRARAQAFLKDRVGLGSPGESR